MSSSFNRHISRLTQFMKYSIVLHITENSQLHSTLFWFVFSHQIWSVTDSTQELSKVTGLVHIVLAQMMQSHLNEVAHAWSPYSHFVPHSGKYHSRMCCQSCKINALYGTFAYFHLWYIYLWYTYLWYIYLFNYGTFTYGTFTYGTFSKNRVWHIYLWYIYRTPIIGPPSWLIPG